MQIIQTTTSFDEDIFKYSMCPCKIFMCDWIKLFNEKITITLESHIQTTQKTGRCFLEAMFSR